MASILNEGYRKARKQHKCDGWAYLDDWQYDIEELKLCRGISKGDEYYYQTNTLDGLRTFKSCKQCMNEAKTHNLPFYEE